MDKGVVVALTHSGFYYAGRAVINRIVSRDPYLLDVRVLEVCDNIEMIIPYPTGDLKYLSQCAGRNIVWEERYVYPYFSENDTAPTPVGWQPTLDASEEKPIDQFLTLTVNMEVALLHSDGSDHHCAGVGVIVECSRKGTWEGFRVPQSFFVIIRFMTVKKDFLGLAVYCENSDLTSLGDCLGYRILWSGYKVRPLDPSTAEEHPIGWQPTVP